MTLNISRKAIYYGLGGGAAIVLGAVAFKLLTPTAPPVQVAPHQFVNVSAIERGVQDCATYVRTGEGLGPSAYLCVKDTRDLVVRWENFPRDTPTTVTIYRAEAGSDTLETWRIITVTGESGEAVIRANLTPGEIGSLAGGESGTVAGTIGGTAFYIEATSPTGTIIFASAPSSTATSTTPATATSTPASTSTTPATQSPMPTSTPVVSAPSSTATSTTPATATSTATSTPTSTLPSTPTAPTSPTPTTPANYYYYSPSGVPTPAPGEPTKNFWVQHVNQKIEIGWYNLPQETTRVSVLRAESPSGPWANLLTQENPVTSRYSIYLVDSTLGATHYYTLNVYNGATFLAAYGPEELAPLAP